MQQWQLVIIPFSFCKCYRFQFLLFKKGAAAMMAIRVLVDHDVPEENITLVSLLMAVSGVHTIAYAFKNVQMVTSEVDPSFNAKFQIEPGFGNFADRYFGTERSC